MIVKGVNEKGKRVEINDDFSVFIKKPLVYIDEFENSNVITIIRPTEKLINYKDGKFSISEEVKINGNFNIISTGSFSGVENLDDNFNLDEMLKKMSSESKNVSINFNINGNTRSLGKDEFRRMYKVCVDEPNIKAGFYSMGIMGITVYVPIILTKHKAYSGQIKFANDDFEENEMWITEILCSLEPLNVEKDNIDILDLTDLEQLTYSKKTIECGSLKLMISNELKYSEKENISDEFELIAVSKNYKKSFMKYNNAPVGICIRKPVRVNGLDKIWKDKKDKLKELLKKTYQEILTKSYGKYDGEISIHSVNDNSAILYAPTNSSEPDEQYWTSFGFIVYHNNVEYPGMIYLNCNKPTNKQLDTFVNEFLNSIQFNEDNYISYMNELKEEQLGEFSHKDGKIDAIKVSNMFFDDIIFNNPDEIKYDGEKHYITGLQMNAELIDNYPVLKKNSRTFIEEIYNLITYLEDDKKLIVNSNDYHKNFNNITNKQPITGVIYFLMAAWHMIKIIEENENEYKVMIDENIIHGLPNGYSLLTEYIDRLRKYNNISSDFKVS